MRGEDGWVNRMAIVIHAFLEAGADPKVFFIASMEGQLFFCTLNQLLANFNLRNMAGIESLVSTRQVEAEGALRAMQTVASLLKPTGRSKVLSRLAGMAEKVNPWWAALRFGYFELGTDHAPLATLYCAVRASVS